MVMTKLADVKVGKSYLFTINYNYGAGSGSQGSTTLAGVVKELNAEWMRVIPSSAAPGSKRSIKVWNSEIAGVVALA
jgi:hypothetical protein